MIIPIDTIRFLAFISLIGCPIVLLVSFNVWMYLLREEMRNQSEATLDAVYEVEKAVRDR